MTIDSGRQGHGKLLYAMPFGLALPSKKVTRSGTTIYELRCATTTHGAGRPAAEHPP